VDPLTPLEALADADKSYRDFHETACKYVEFETRVGRGDSATKRLRYLLEGRLARR
jgi:hypothetical protein